MSSNLALQESAISRPINANIHPSACDYRDIVGVTICRALDSPRLKLCELHPDARCASPTTSCLRGMYQHLFLRRHRVLFFVFSRNADQLARQVLAHCPTFPALSFQLSRNVHPVDHKHTDFGLRTSALQQASFRAENPRVRYSRTGFSDFASTVEQIVGIAAALLSMSIGSGKCRSSAFARSCSLSGAIRFPDAGSCSNARVCRTARVRSYGVVTRSPPAGWSQEFCAQFQPRRRRGRNEQAQWSSSALRQLHGHSHTRCARNHPGAGGA